MRVQFRNVVSFCAVFFLCAGGADLFAQVPTGTILGTVKDAQGLSIPGATVTLTNQGTTRTQTDTTSSLGGFQFTHLNSGLYRIDVSKTGFKSSLVTDIKLDASTEYSVPPIQLEVGTVSETVTVVGGADLVRTAGAELTDTVEREQIQELPILNRNPLNLLSLEAGVSKNGRFATVINGQRQSYSDMTLDGINIQDNYVRAGSLDYTPNLLLMSQVGEFTTTTQNAGPQAGLGSSQVSMVTPSGTNDWHGEGFWNYRSDALAANTWFNDANGVTKPNLLLNQAGGDIGGPVVKNKLFIYGAYELYRSKQQVPVTNTVLTPSARNGIFKWLDSSNTVQCARIVVISNVTTPPGCSDLTSGGAPALDPYIANLLKQVPTTINNASVGDGLNTGGYSFNQRYNDTRDNASVRVDWNASAHNSFTGTYAWNRELVDRPGSSIMLANTPDAIPQTYNDDKENFLSVAWRWSPTTNFTNEVRFGFDLAPISFLTRQQTNTFTVSGTLFDNPDQNAFPNSRKTHTWSWQDNASWVHGNHTLSFGMQVQRVTIFAQDYTNTVPNLTIDDEFSDAALGSGAFPSGISDTSVTTANELLGTLAGIISEEQQTFNVTSRTSGYVPGAPAAENFRYDNWSVYAGDSWRLRRNLTVTYGLRWEYNSPFDERDGLLLLPVVPPGQTVEQTLLSDATINFAGGTSGRRPYGRDLNNFAPNIGIAWDPFGDGKTSIRAGFSINYVNDELISAPYNSQLLGNNPGLNTSTGNFGLATTISSPLPPIAVPPVAIPSTFSENLANIAGYIPAYNYGYAIDPNLRTPYVEQWNLTIQRELGWNTSLSVSYVGNRGIKLYQGIDLNQVQIKSNGFLNAFNIARQNGFLALAKNGTFDPTYNSGVPGSQPTTFFDDNLYGGGYLSSAYVENLIQQGQVGELANTYSAYGYIMPGSSLQIAPNPLVQAADLLGNFSSSMYNAGTIEIRHRFSHGLAFQANYTFSKVFTNYSGDTSDRFAPLLDNAQPNLQWARANFDLTHAFKANFRYKLPFGRGNTWAPSNRFLSQLVSDWTTSSIVTWQSGPPFSILSGEGTLNRQGRSLLTNTAYTTSTPQQIAGQLGTYQSNGEVLLINPKFVGPDGTGAPNDALSCMPLVSGGFCNPQPGTVGNLPINAFNGPAFFNWDLGIIKGFPITESKLLEFRVEMFNATNHPTFAVGDPNYAAQTGGSASDMYIDDPKFGVATTTAFPPRVIQIGLRFSF